MLDQLQQWDRETFIYLNGLGIEEYDAFWSVVTKFGTWTPLFLLIIFLIFWRNNLKRAGWNLLFLVLMVLSVAFAIDATKEYIGRLRPNNDTEINQLIRILHTPTDFSFFSGHAASSFSIATMAVLLLRDRYKWIYFIFLWPLLFSFSRIYLGVHYPLDILVGALVGVGFAFLFNGLRQRIKVPYST
ncbi:phosphatase PAP2 family protein [Flavobacteriaceae bacterium TP-CH-4]|uniref:Phosphatase PAP2 family protein n=1 Tax=Pelagihabitans pacificus TaxID=2696054 RepID=A0A967AVP1_9FLAO|nr:phosphatase PAP2 family protein [Pelagihabitans pacificus]NHF60802.1 phosphatase PAP2 family protein [Pelagihabitans pacificus]